MDDETLLFRFSDGGRWRAADPFWADREMAVALGGEPLAAVVEQAKGEGAPGLAALRRLDGAVRQAFGLAPQGDDGSGPTAATAFRVLREYCRWRDEVKKKAGRTPSSSPPTAPPPSAAP